MKVGQAQWLLLAALQLLALPAVATCKKGHQDKHACKPKPYPKPHPKPQPSPPNACKDVVNIMKSKLAKAMILLPGSAEYTEEMEEYWNQQTQETLPKIIIRPTNSHEASKAMKVISENKCKFAIRAGGHATNSEANNSNNVLIVLSALNTLAWKNGYDILSIGPGQRWGQVYAFAETKSKTVVGGRYAAVGVGGYLLGGGLSFYSYKYGFGADMVVNMEVVLADGSVINVNENQKPDLFWALKGGHNNFALVTRFDVQTVPHTQIFGGLLTVLPQDMDKVFAALNKWQNEQEQDLNASVQVSFLRGPLIASNDYSIASIVLFYGAPVVNPPCLKPFLDLPAVQSTVRLTTHRELTQELAAANNNDKRHLFYVGGYEAKRNTPLNKIAHDTYFDSISQSDFYQDPNGYTAFTLQTIGKRLLRDAGTKNALSISAKDAPYVWYNIHLEYSAGASYLDSIALDAARTAHQKIQIEVKKHRAENPFLYINDGGPDQNIIQDSYGSQTVKKMREVSHKYDPNQVFQKQVSGVYKLW